MSTRTADGSPNSPLGGHADKRCNQRPRFLFELAVLVGGEVVLGGCDVGQKTKAVNDPADYAVQIGLLVLAQKGRQVTDVIVALSGNPVAEAVVVEAGAAAIPELEDSERSLRSLVETDL
jgi:hypothetical protein